jgi:hypothetical protein
MNYISIGGNQKVIPPLDDPGIAVKITRTKLQAHIFDLKIPDLPRKIDV